MVFYHLPSLSQVTLKIMLRGRLPKIYVFLSLSYVGKNKFRELKKLDKVT